MPMQYKDIFQEAKIENFIGKFSIFLIFAQNIHLGDAVLTCTHNVCFGTQIRKIGKPLYIPVLLGKTGV